jgi:predicted nucleic acid-binding protein
VCAAAADLRDADTRALGCQRSVSMRLPKSAAHHDASYVALAAALNSEHPTGDARLAGATGPGRSIEQLTAAS